MSEIVDPEQIAEYAERRVMFAAFERAANQGTGLAFLRQIVAHPFEDEVVVALVFCHVNSMDEAHRPVCDCGTFWTAEEVPEYLGDMWGPWVG